MSIAQAVLLTNWSQTTAEHRLLLAELRHVFGDIVVHVWPLIKPEMVTRLPQLPVVDTVFLTDACLLRGGPEFGQWCAVMLERARGGVIGVDGESDLYDYWPAMQAQLQTAGIDCDDWQPGTPTTSPHFCLVGQIALQQLCDTGWLIQLAGYVADDSVVLSELEPLSWLSLLLSLAGAYRIGVGSVVRPMPPLLLWPSRAGYVIPPPHLFNSDIAVVAPVTAVAGYSELLLRRIACVQRGEAAADGWIKQAVSVYLPGGPGNVY